MATDNKSQLVFPVGFNFDTKSLDAIWDKEQKKIQAIIDRNKFKLRVSFDETAIKNVLTVLDQIQIAQQGRDDRSLRSAAGRLPGFQTFEHVSLQKLRH